VSASWTFCCCFYRGTETECWATLLISGSDLVASHCKCFAVRQMRGGDWSGLLCWCGGSPERSNGWTLCEIKRKYIAVRSVSCSHAVLVRRDTQVTSEIATLRDCLVQPWLKELVAVQRVGDVLCLWRTRGNILKIRCQSLDCHWSCRRVLFSSPVNLGSEIACRWVYLQFLFSAGTAVDCLTDNKWMNLWIRERRSCSFREFCRGLISTDIVPCQHLVIAAESSTVGLHQLTDDPGLSVLRHYSCVCLIDQ
jgi:hypothetical protein